MSNQAFVVHEHQRAEDGVVSRVPVGSYPSLDEAIAACNAKWDSDSPQEIAHESSGERWGRNIDTGEFEQLP